MSEQNKDVVREYYARVINGRDLGPSASSSPTSAWSRA